MIYLFITDSRGGPLSHKSRPLPAAPSIVQQHQLPRNYHATTLLIHLPTPSPLPPPLLHHINYLVYYQVDPPSVNIYLSANDLVDLK